MRTVIVHYHLFKNAGSTVDGVLSRNFPGDQHGHIEGPYPWSTVQPQELVEFALANPTLRVMSSHQARLPLPQHPEIRFLPILFLRHPIDRFASVYEFERRQPVDSLSPSVVIARNGGLAEFAKWVVSEEATAVCRNFHVAHLANAQHDMRTARTTHEDYLSALRHLESLPVFGVVESFEESIDLMQALFGPHFENIDFAYSNENVTPGRHATLSERLAHIRSELGETLYRNLLEMNSLDMLLYEDGRRLFAAALQARAPLAAAQAQPKGFRRRIVRALRGTPSTSA
ncbi:sulfotransferase family 2 domain-containing protein [Paraburkholderia azotifigens]|uniref:sulfotransferase family 2 domain-containing protein n=1 Tax=Paraburkholderia azotifigens TaxID=2057004 RepID=UPI0031788D20